MSYSFPKYNVDAHLALQKARKEQEARRKKKEEERKKRQAALRSKPTAVSQVDVAKGGPAALIKATGKDMVAREKAKNPDTPYTEEQVIEMITPGRYTTERVQERQADEGVGAVDDIRDRTADDPGELPTGSEPTVTRREEKRDGSKGTQTSPPPVKPADFDAFQKTLEQSYGINFNFGQGRGGMQSNSLPNTPGNVPDTSSGNIVRISNGQNSGNYVKVDNPNFDKIIRGEVVGGFSQAQGAQAGTSSDADVGDQMRALRFDPTKYKEDPERPTDIYETADVGIGRRGAAFLDYDGDSAMALRAAEASQRTIRQNGVTYGKGEDGNWTAISEEGNKALKTDGNKIASQDFLKQYMATPAESQSESSGNPAPASRETYQQMADKELTGTVYVPSETNKVEAFAPNASIYSGNPKDFNLEDSDFFQGQPTGEPNKSWLPTEDENKEREELMRGLY